MKKLLLVLVVVALASFLFVGCIPGGTTPDGDGGGDGEVGICPTVAVTSQVAIGGKTYIKGGKQTITVTFAVPTEPVSVYVGSALRDVDPLLEGEVVMYTTDKLVYTGTFTFAAKASDCAEAYIYVDTCEACAYCKYPYTVDTTGPASEIKISNGAVCVCEGCTIDFDSTKDTTVCTTDVCCGDYCSGFASYAIDLYTSPPFDECCDVPCVTPAYSCPGGVACPIDCTLTCITGTTTTTDKVYYVVATLLDNVGNRTRYYATLTLDSACGLTVQEYVANVQAGLCSDYTDTTGFSSQLVTPTDPAEIGACLTTL
jgi:hypothetical protein